MVIDRVYKVSAFGYFNDIVPDSDNMMFFLNTFKDIGLFPSMAQEINTTAGISGNTPMPVNRIALMSNDGQEQVIIGTNRIDYAINVPDDVKLSQEEIEKIRLKIANFLEQVFQKYSKRAIRLALNTESWLMNLSDIEITTFLSKYSNPISIYSKGLAEWNIHLMVKKTISLEENEDLNVITNISKAVITKRIGDNNVVSNGFILQTDINTVAENTKQRFSNGSIGNFISEANTLWALIVGEVSSDYGAK